MSTCDPLRSLGAICVAGFMLVPVTYLNRSILLKFFTAKKNPASSQLRGFADLVPAFLGDQCYPAECGNNCQT